VIALFDADDAVIVKHPACHDGNCYDFHGGSCRGEVGTVIAGGSGRPERPIGVRFKDDGWCSFTEKDLEYRTRHI
jgi:hypothetical protein